VRQAQRVGCHWKEGKPTKGGRRTIIETMKTHTRARGCGSLRGRRCKLDKEPGPMKWMHGNRRVGLTFRAEEAQNTCIRKEGIRTVG